MSQATKMSLSKRDTYDDTDDDDTNDDTDDDSIEIESFNLEK